MSETVVLAVEQLRRRVPGGIGRYAEGLLAGLKELDERGIELLASRAPRAGADPLERFGYPVRTRALPGVLLARAWDAGLLAERHAKVVHSVSLGGPPVRPRSRRGGPACVVTVHDLAWRSHPEATTARGRRWHERALGRALGRADAFVVPSEPVAAELVRAGARSDRVRVVPHGVDHLPPPDEAGATALLERAGVGEGFLLAVGTLEPRKNLGRVVRAYALARGDLEGARTLVVVGPRGWGRATPAGHEGVRVVGPVGDAVLAALYKSARALVYVPITEGFGLPPLEAMASGTPVVTSTAVPSVTPEPGDEAAAIRVDPCSVEEIARAMVAVVPDGPRRASLIERGNALAASRTWKASASAHVAWWREVT